MRNLNYDKHHSITNQFFSGQRKNKNIFFLVYAARFLFRRDCTVLKHQSLDFRCSLSGDLLQPGSKKTGLTNTLKSSRVCAFTAKTGNL